MTTKFEQINQLIKEDPDFQNQLSSITEQATWIKSVIEFCQGKGICITYEEVNDKLISRLEQLAQTGRLVPVGPIFRCTAATSPF